MPETFMEIVARAIAKTQGVDPSKDGNWEPWLKKARAAIEAMREPSFEMGEAGHVPVEAISDMEIIPYDSVTHKSCVDIWQAMIDEVLND